jgi:8-oxo-dGTP pyrophosphatase MutT (NUDIX family)
MSRLADAGRLLSSLRALDVPPALPGWNHAELADLLGDAQRTPAAVLLPLVRRESGDALLFTVRNEGLRTHAGQVSFPGGRIEADDADAVAAALRETEEETGIRRALMRPRGYLDCFETISGFGVTPVVAEIASDYVLAPDPREVADVFEVPLPFLLDAANLRRSEIDWRGRRREIYEYDYAGRRIWGATAAMLVNLLRRMEALP